MAKKVTYTPERKWTRDVAAQIQPDGTAGAAREVLAFAQSDDPRGDYKMRPAVVTAGRGNEKRAGYIVEEQARSWSGVYKRTLVRASQQARRM